VLAFREGMTGGLERYDPYGSVCRGVEVAEPRLGYGFLAMPQ
jgi:hypothetical protein